MIIIFLDAIKITHVLSKLMELKFKKYIKKHQIYLIFNNVIKKFIHFIKIKSTAETINVLAMLWLQ